jgi:hypothetical protein
MFYVNCSQCRIVDQRVSDSHFRQHVPSTRCLMSNQTKLAVSEDFLAERDFGPRLENQWSDSRSQRDRNSRESER